jgi:hypothetical protein
LINDPKRTPFNIGQRVELTDFTLDEAAALGLPTDQTQELLKWTSGHPYLTQRLCVALLSRSQITEESALAERAKVDQVVASTFFSEKGQQDINLQFVRWMLTERAPDTASSEMEIAVLSTYRDIRQGRTVRHEPTPYSLLPTPYCKWESYLITVPYYIRSRKT